MTPSPSTLSESNPTTATNNNNARSLAQEAVSWYLDQLDPLQPHAVNVQTYLRGPVTALTASILGETSTTTTTTTAAKQKAPPPSAATSTTTNAPAAKSPTATTVTQNGKAQNGDDSKKPSVNGKKSNRAKNNKKTKPDGDSKQETLTNGGKPNGTKNGKNAKKTPKATNVSEKVDPRHPLDNATSSASWRDYLKIGPDASLAELFAPEKTKQTYDSLDNRSKARLDAFLEGVALAVISEKPPELPSRRSRSNSYGSSDSFSLIEGLVGFQGGGIEKPPAVLASLKKASSSTGSAVVGNSTCSQLGEHELVTRLELYLRYILRVQQQHQHCILEPVRALKARARSVVAAFVDTVGTVRHVSPVLTKLLVTTTKEVLAVNVISTNLASVIRKIVSNYVHTTSFASLAFLSSPENSADQRLTPVILQYLVSLEKNWEKCVAECDLELMLATCLDRDMRRTFKNAEFQSIGHLLEVCQSFRQELHNIELPPSPKCSTINDDNDKLQQAARDMQREVIAVNGSVLPPVKSRGDLIELLSSALNTRTVMESDGGRRHGRRRSSTKKKKKRNDNVAASNTAPTSSSDEHWVSSSGNEGDHSESTAAGDVDVVTPVRGNAATTRSGATNRSAARRRSTFQLSTVDLLTKRLLLAASRTGTGGDAYFVVRDLFGGEDVEVVPSQHQHGVRTIDLIVRLASITIKCHASFDVYPKSLVGDCEPLIQIHTTSTETIALQEVRATDQASKSEGGSVMVLQEHQTDTSGRRILSVRPALYEKVEVWNTPS